VTLVVELAHTGSTETHSVRPRSWRAWWWSTPFAAVESWGGGRPPLPRGLVFNPAPSVFFVLGRSMVGWNALMPLKPRPSCTFHVEVGTSRQSFFYVVTPTSDLCLRSRNRPPGVVPQKVLGPQQPEPSSCGRSRMTLRSDDTR